MNTSHMVFFMFMVIVVNLLTYGGVTWIYFRGKNQVDPPRPTETQPAPHADRLMLAEDHQRHRSAA